MSSRPGPEVIRQYLLGDLAEDQSCEIEELYFAEPGFFDEIESAENDLIDQYVLNTLLADEQKKLADRLLTTPSGLRKLRVAMALNDYLKDGDRYEPVDSGETSRKLYSPRYWLNLLRPWGRTGRAGAHVVT